MIISILEDLEQQSIARGIPIVGSVKGAWLLQKIKEVQPERILELGTANGYSGIILGSEGAELTTVELDPKIAHEAKENFAKYSTTARIVVGDAVHIVNTMARDDNNEEAFDFIFIDFAKNGYLQVLENCINLLRVGGVIVADNISFPGCQDYKQAILRHPRLKTEIILIKDGLSCSEKIR